MSMEGRAEEPLGKESATGAKQAKIWKFGSVIAGIAAVTVLIIMSRKYFSFVDAQLYEERKNHIVEFADKASEIIDTIVEYSWQQVSVCRHILGAGHIKSRQELRELLMSTSDFIDKEHDLVIAIDDKGYYYASDSTEGHWLQKDLLADRVNKRQQIVTEMPHKAGKSYFVFIEQLKEPVPIGEDEISITHLLVAVDIDEMREKIAIRGLGDQCYTYLLNGDGRKLYKHTYGNRFIEGYNVLGAFQDLKIVHGGTCDKFIRTLEHGQNTAIEFEFVDDEGKVQNWYVANAAIASEQWQILLFLPTKTLGANTSLILSRTVWFLTTTEAVFMVMVIIIIIFAVLSQMDRKLMHEKDEANRQLKASAEEARRANQAKSNFLANMSHDIRTPINGIMGMTDIALKHIENRDRVLDCLNKISGSSHHLLGLINDVLDMSRIEAGKTTINHEEFDLRICIDNCVSIISGQIAMRDLEMIKEMETLSHPLLIGDDLHMRQIFINILGNSVKFTPDGGKIFFRIKEIGSSENKAHFRFELEDTGIGMKEEFLPHLFDAFAQEDGGMRTTYKGTGLGMAITKRFLDMMGASIEVKSKVNEGTKYTIELWIDIDKNAGQKEENIDVPVDLKGMKILLAEDIALNLEIVQSILEEEGVIVTPVMNGQEAVDAFTKNPPNTFDVILMDIMMPVMDGITAAKTIRALDRPDAQSVPIVAITANAYDEDIQNTRRAGMNEHLSKPIDMDLLLKTVSSFYHKLKPKAMEADLRGMKVLLADDIDLNREIAGEVLKEMGIQVTIVENGQEALEAFEQNEKGAFDAILLDLHMPVMDGITATKAIRTMEREDAHTIPILAMTADVYEEDLKATKAAGMNGHLLKPLDVNQIVEVLAAYRTAD